MNTHTMKPSDLYCLPISHKPWRPSGLRWLMQDLAGVAHQPEQSRRTQLPGANYLAWPHPADHVRAMHSADALTMGRAGIANSPEVQETST